MVGCWFLEQSNISLIGWEFKYNRGFIDVLGLSLSDRGIQKICVAEVKRTRADLLQDLKKHKLLKYEYGSTHCYLAATTEALRLDKQTEKQAVEELHKLGLPKTWGVLVIEQVVRSIHSAQQINKPNSLRIRGLIKKVARSNMWRALKANGIREPVSDTEEEY